MRTSSLKRQIQAMLCGTIVAGSALTLGATRAEAVQAQAVGEVRLSAGSQRVLQGLMAELPAYAQQLVRNAVAALGPRVEAVLSQYQAVPPDWLATASRNIAGMLALVSPQYHQTLVNGLFQVSAPEVQFANQAIYQIQARTAAVSYSSPAYGAVQPGISAEDQAARDAQIRATMDRIYQLQQGAAMTSHRNTQMVADGWIRALGTTPYPMPVETEP